MKRIGIICLSLIVLITLFGYPFSGAFGENILSAYKAETVKANSESDFYGFWICRYISGRGITMRIEDMIATALRTNEPNLSEEEIQEQIAESKIYMIINKEHIHSYMGNPDQQDPVKYTFADGILQIGSDSNAVKVELLADGNLQMVNSGGTYIFEKIQEEADQTAIEIQPDAEQSNLDSPYKLLVINDDANLLNDEENRDVLEAMKPLAKYANVGFYTYPADGGNVSASATKAQKWGDNLFGSDGFIVFIIDMSTRHLDIYASRQMVEMLNTAMMNSIVDNVYLYATRGEYGECACMTFKLILNKLKGSQ